MSKRNMMDNNSQPIGMDGQALVDEYQSYRRIGSWLIIGGFLILMIGLSISAWFDSQAASPSEIGKLGVHLLLDDGRNRWDEALWDGHLAAASEVSSTGGIAVQVIRSDDLDSARWQPFIDLTATYEMTPVLRLATTFDFDNGWWTIPERDTDGSYRTIAQDYADFLNSLTWQSSEKYVLLLNEPNNGHEWGGIPDPEAYAQFVIDVAAVLREQVEGIVILNGAFDLNLPNTNGEVFPNSNVQLIDANTYIDRMEAAQPDIFSTFDLWNSHPYPLDIRANPNEQVYRFDAMNGSQITAPTPPDGIFNRGVNGYAWELWKLAQLGYDTSTLQIMITETGWRHNNPIDAESADAALDYPSPEQVADYFELALLGGDDVTFTPWLDDERVIAIAPFALNGVPDEWSYTNLLEINAEGNIIGRYAHYDRLAEIAANQ